MANEISVAASTGTVVYAVVRDTQARPWNTGTSALEAYNEAHWTNYAITLTEQGSSGVFAGDFPSALSTAGVYSVEARTRAGGSPAVGDTRLGTGSLVWTGTREAFVVSNATGQVQHDLAQTVPASNTAQTVGDALNGARAQAFGKWVLSGTQLQLFAGDGATVVRTFTLDSAGAPTSRT